MIVYRGIRNTGKYLPSFTLHSHTILFYAFPYRNRPRYETGDHVGVYAHNNASIVNALGMLLNTNLDAVFALKAVEGRV